MCRFSRMFDLVIVVILTLRCVGQWSTHKLRHILFIGVALILFQELENRRKNLGFPTLKNFTKVAKVNQRLTIGRGQDLHKNKREAGNPIINTLSKATSAIFSVCKRPTGTCLQSLEDTARYAGLLLAPAEGFGLRQRPYKAVLAHFWPLKKS